VRSVTALCAFRYGHSCVSLRVFVCLVAHLTNRPCIAFGCPSCQLALHCPWSPNLGQAPHVFHYGSSCVWVPMLRSRLALRWDTHLPNLPYIVFEPPTLVSAYKKIYLQAKIGSYPSSVSSFCLVLPCVVVFVTALHDFRYGHSCISLRLFMCLGAYLANWPCIAFGCPSCQLPLPCIVFGRPSCELALPCVRAPNLGEAVLKTLPPSQNWFLPILRLIFVPSASFVWSFSLRLFVRFVTTIRAFRYDSSCVWSAISPTGLALHLGAPLANSPCLALGRPTLARLLVRFFTALRAFGCPCCEVALCCIWAPILRTHLVLRSGTQPW
jgi:hypothetical protein